MFYYKTRKLMFSVIFSGGKEPRCRGEIQVRNPQPADGGGGDGSAREVGLMSSFF